jgi:hypothetical protein
LILNSRDTIEIISVIIALIGVFFGALEYNDSHNLHEAKESTIVNNSIVNNNVVVAPPNTPKEITPTPESPETDQDSRGIIEASPIEQIPAENPSEVGSNTKNALESKNSISFSQVKQHSTTSQTITESTGTLGIGENVPGRGYFLTNEYEKNSLPPTCTMKSVVNYCDTSDSCVDCDGICWLPGTYLSKNGVTSTCSNGKWMRS